MAKAKSGKPSGKPEAETAKPDETVAAVTETAAEGQDGVAPSDPSPDEPPVVQAEPAKAEASEVDSDALADEVTNSKGAAEVLDEETADDVASSEVEDILADTQTAEPTPTPAPVVQEKVIERKGGFVPMALGGVVAAALGFGAAQFTDFGAEPNPFEAEARATIEAQAKQIADLEAGIADAQKAIGIIDLGPVMSSVAGVEDALSGMTSSLAALETGLAGLDSRMTALEKAPVAGAVGPEAIAAYERELEELRLAITAQKQAVEEQKAEIQAMAQKALADQSSAQEQAQLASSRSILAELIALAQDGKPFAEPLAQLEENGVQVPDAIASRAIKGVPTLTALATEFPDLARDALSAARRNAPADEGSGGLANFLSNQLGARSVTPREGNDPDAVLSRAEAAIKVGDLDATLGELQALPAEAQAVLADWVARATARNEALAAAQSLAQELNKE
ncbi:mitofilin family membrane protein [Tropicibacter oceani]|uniref:Mitofilin family membrane protein n=1 Tax=Tropicibacter oceani TaxID=3058420 RepID=A0ABY8QIQ7_9RHOB|nr:mitofilin family membrane protein [Tropicibacter oceani]WGW04541.1 mitofilin family membrane protein [Tropicibacter oceani]